MPISPSQALEAMQHTYAARKTQGDLLIAGATGALGNAAMQRLVGAHRFAHTRVLAREPIAQGMRLVSLMQVQPEIEDWPQADLTGSTGLVMFEPPRMYYERERALWTPSPQELPQLAAWLKSCGVTTLAIALPHAQGSLPESLRRGLASLDEQALTALGFERLIILRSAQKPVAQQVTHPLQKLAQWMLGIFQFMVPASEQPVRPTRIAELLDALLQHTPPGIWIVAQQQVWSWAQLPSSALEGSVKAWAQAGSAQ
jgi:hypothetical protein